jgi:hypothetical protein
MQQKSKRRVVHSPFPTKMMKKWLVWPRQNSSLLGQKPTVFHLQHVLQENTKDTLVMYAVKSLPEAEMYEDTKNQDTIIPRVVDVLSVIEF